MASEILQDLDDETKVLTITLNRPGAGNAFNQALISDYISALEEASNDPEVRSIITRANGADFCAGMDPQYMAEATDEFGSVPWTSIDQRAGVDLYRAIEMVPKPLIAQVQGSCIGEAISIVALHDFAVAAKSAKFALAPLTGSSFGPYALGHLLSHGIPVKKVAALQLSGRSIDGDAAEAIGLVSFAVEDASLNEATAELAKELASRNPRVVEHGKLAIRLDEEVPVWMSGRMDSLVGYRMRRGVNPYENLEGYLASQKGGTNRRYVRPGDVSK